MITPVFNPAWLASKSELELNAMEAGARFCASHGLEALMEIVGEKHRRGLALSPDEEKLLPPGAFEEEEEFDFSSIPPVRGLCKYLEPCS